MMATQETTTATDDDVPVNNLVYILVSDASSDLARLQEEFSDPDIAPLFRTGRMLGTSTKRNDRLLRAKAKVAHASVPPLLMRSAKETTTTKGLLRRSSRLLVVSRVCTMIGSAGIVGT